MPSAPMRISKLPLATPSYDEVSFWSRSRGANST